MHTRRKVTAFWGLLFLLTGLACDLSQVVPQATHTSPAQPTEPASIVGGVAQQTLPTLTQNPQEPVVTLDPCTLLSRDDAAAILGEPVNEAKINGGACTYSNAANGVYVVSAYALQGQQTQDQWSGRLFLLGMFGLQIEQPSLDEIKALDAAGDQKAILAKISALAAGNSAFISRSLDGIGESAYWAWKDLGNGVRQGFLIAVKGDVLAGMDIVHGENLDESIALAQASKLVTRIFDRLPPRFTIQLIVPTPTSLPPTEVPTLVPIPSPTLVPISLPSPTEIGGGKLIAFESDRDGSQQIYTMDVEGKNARRLTFTGANFAPAWSPDGKQIAFYSIRGQFASLYVMNTERGGERMLFDSAYIAGGPTWSPDGSRIAFVSNRDGNLEIYAVNLDGSGLANLSNNPTGDTDPDWSPDGSRIAFVSQRSGTNELWLMNADGSGVLQIATTGMGVNAPDWSPDGSRIAFASRVPGGYGQIFVINVDGTGLVNLTNNDMDNLAPEWSPDGVFILFYGAVYKGNWDIYRMNYNGSQQINLTGDQLTNESFPDWQP
jgi:Tol biopolymer transport system component